MPAVLHKEIASAFLQAGRPDDALAYLQRPPAVKPTSERYWLLSRAHLQERSMTAALAAWKQAGSFRDDNPLRLEPAPFVGSQVLRRLSPRHLPGSAKLAACPDLLSRL